jgi:hypothetical protein
MDDNGKLGATDLIAFLAGNGFYNIQLDKRYVVVGTHIKSKQDLVFAEGKHSREDVLREIERICEKRKAALEFGNKTNRRLS